MGKGKRNRQFHYEDRQANPEKYKEKDKKRKQPFRMPKWGWRVIGIVLVLAVVVGIAASIVINSGVFLRNRILVQSKSGQYDLNQQMATFIVWQNLYQEFYYQYYYYAWGLQEDTEGVLKQFANAVDYAIYYASAYTTSALRDGIESYKDYLVELVAGADAGLEAGLTLSAEDIKETQEMKEWLENVRAGSSYSVNYKYDSFLKKFVGTGMAQEDIDAAANLLAMYTKYCNSTKYGIDATPEEDDLLDFIARNPSNKYETDYRFYKVFDVETAKELEKVTSAEEFKEKVFDLVFEQYYEEGVITRFVRPAAEADRATFVNLKDQALTDKLNALGITKATHKSSETLDKKLADWIFDSKRVAGNSTVITGEDGVYLAYTFSAPTADATDKKVTTVEAGWKKYTVADFAAQTEGFAENIKADIESGKYTGTAHSAEYFAKEFLDKLKAGTATLPEDAIQVTTKEPVDSSVTNTAPQAILEALYGNTKISVGTKLMATDDLGTAYVLVVNAINGKNYNIKYTTFEDSDYYSIHRTVEDAWELAYPEKATTLAHPETTEKGSFQEWLCESKVTDATADTITQREFARKAGDAKYFKTVASSTATSDSSFTVYFVEKPMELIKTEDKTVYGGYILFSTDAAAREMLGTLTGMKGFELWNNFNFLTYTSTGSDGKEKVTDSTMNTAFEEDDITSESLRKWLFSEDRKQDDLTVIAADDGFYLAYYYSSESLWVRTAKDGWVAEELANMLEARIEEKGYAMNEDVLKKIGKVTLTTTEGTTAEETTAEETTAAA